MEKIGDNMKEIKNDHKNENKCPIKTSERLEEKYKKLYEKAEKTIKTLSSILVLAIGTILAVFGWFIREVLKKMHSTEDMLNQHIVDDTEIQTALNTNMTSQIKLVEKLDSKMDQFNDKIDKRDARLSEKIDELSDKID
jgi:sensor domain CHASE-containing protein